MLGSVSGKSGRRGCGKAVGIGCLVFTIMAVIAIVWFLKFLVAPGEVPPAEVFITPECKGFLIVRIDPADKGVRAFLVDREKKFQRELRSSKTKRPPWIFRQMFGETPSQTWQKLMPVQMVWTVERKPGDKELAGMSMFSMSRGKGIFWGFRSQLAKNASGAEPAEEYKDMQIVLLKDVAEGKEGPEKSPEEKGKEQEQSAQQPPGTPIPGLRRPTTYPWITIFETNLLEASTFEGLKKAIDLATDPDAKFAGRGFIKTAYKGFAGGMEAIGALADDEETAAHVMSYLLSMLTGEKAGDIRVRVKLPGIQRLSGCANVVGADRVHVRLKAICADEKKAQAVHTTLAIELGAMKEKRSIEALAHSVEGTRVTVELDVTDLDDLPRGSRDAREEAQKKLEEEQRKKDAGGDADGDH